MEKQGVANIEAVKSGCVVSIVALVLLSTSLSWYMLPALPAFIMAVPLPTVIGAFMGKSFVKTRVGTWLGAGCGAILGLWLFYSIISNMVLD